MGSSADAGHTVETFPIPAGATPGLADIIQSAHQSVQDSVDQLGAGHPEKAPNYVELLEHDGLAKVNAGKAEMVSNYESKLSSLDKIKSTLAGQDTTVGDSAFQAGTIPGDTWSTIESRVRKLVATLKGAPAPSPGQKYLPANIRAALQDAVLAALTDIGADIEHAHEQMVALAVSLSAPGATPAGIDSQLASAKPTPWSKGATAVELTGGQKATAQEIYQYLINTYHLTPAQAAGVVGNMEYESSLDTGSFNSVEGAYGLCQWEGGRLTDLQRFAAAQDNGKGKPVGDWKVQVDFMMTELKGGESGAYAQLRSTTTPTDAASAFDQYYERSDGSARNQRILNAETAARTLTV